MFSPLMNLRTRHLHEIVFLVADSSTELTFQLCDRFTSSFQDLVFDQQ